jgi:hypothetical protein
MVVEASVQLTSGGVTWEKYIATVSGDTLNFELQYSDTSSFNIVAFYLLDENGNEIDSDSPSASPGELSIPVSEAESQSELTIDFQNSPDDSRWSMVIPDPSGIIDQAEGAEFDPNAVSMSCNGTDDEVNPGQEASAFVSLTNENATNAICEVQVTIDGADAYLADDLVVQSNDTQSYRLDFTAPSETGEYDIGTELVSVRESG